MTDIDWDYLINMFDDGMIFVVDSTTFEDVVDTQLFGLPLSYLKEMKLLNPGRSALFFFERNAQTISGLFTPSAKAQANINTEVWKHRNGSCKFPAQIPWQSVHKLPTIPKNHPKLPRFIRSMKIKGKYLDCLRLREMLFSFRDICSEGPSFSTGFQERRPQRSRRRAHRDKKVGKGPDWNYYMERRHEYEQAMASYSDSQSSDAEQKEYSRSPTWSWDYGDNSDAAAQPQDYSYPIEATSRSTSPQPPLTDVYKKPVKEFRGKPHREPHRSHREKRRGRKHGNSRSHYRDHRGGFNGKYLGPQCAFDGPPVFENERYYFESKLTLDTADFMDFYMKGSAKTQETGSVVEPVA